MFAAAVKQTPVLTDYNDVVQQIYIGYFGRPADAGGLAYWEAQFLAAGAATTVTGIVQAYNSNATVKLMIDSFSTSEESSALYPGNNNTFILAIYKNLFNRVADNAGLAYWAGLVDAGLLTRSDAAISIMAGAQGTDTSVITNKTLVASNFTNALDTPLKTAAYSGLNANVGVRAMLGIVSDITDVENFQSTVSATISGLTGTQTNMAPVAVAGIGQNIINKTLVTLDGSASSDANGAPLTYLWTLTSKPASSVAILTGSTSSVPSFTADVSGTYVASLVVNDGKFNSTTSTVTVTASGTNVFAMIAAGSYYSTALKSNGTVWTWGHNLYGTLGDGSRGYQTNDPNPSPSMISGLTGVVAVSAGDTHTVALKSDGTVIAWGKNSYGELGDGTSANTRANPVSVLGLTGVAAVSTGTTHTVALKSDGTVVTWGNNFKGQLGDGTTTDRLSPVTVPGLTGVVEVAAGSFFTLALKADGTVWSWGDHAGGELADGTVIDSLSPISIPGLAKVARIAAAANGGHRLALKTDGTVWSWGWNSLGPLGDGTMTNRWTPQAVQGLTGVLMLAAGDNHSVALKSDGTVWAWGYNGLGQLGDGTKMTRLWPVTVNGLSGVVAVVAGNAHTLAVKSDGTVWAWGYNESGQLGDGAINPEMRLSPTQVTAGLNLKN